MSPVAEPAGSVLAAQGAGVGNYALSEGTQSERTSSTLSNLGTPRGLQKLLKKQYHPSEDTYERYSKRVHRLVAALDMANIHTDEKWWGPMLWDAEITSKIHPLEDEQQVAWLKRAFGQILSTSEDSMDDTEREWRLDVVSRRLKEKGYNTPSRYVDKIAAGSPPSYNGTPFKFMMKGRVPPAKAPLMPLNLDKKLEGQERVLTPRTRKQDQASNSPSIAGPAQEAVQAAILERLDRMERNVNSNASTNEGLMASALVKQTEMMEKLFNKRTESRRGVIRIEPKVHWPILNNDDLEVGEFYEEFESMWTSQRHERPCAYGEAFGTQDDP